MKIPLDNGIKDNGNIKINYKIPECYYIYFVKYYISTSSVNIMVVIRNKSLRNLWV
ncbi:hypothetical protein EMIT0210MI2_250004 [Priestia megaterium]